jgi:hypothetical protein
MDTLRGNHDDQTVTMYWGNPTASSTQRHGSVFDTASGFEGVWHLGADAADATVNKYDGVSPDTAIPAVAPGVIGEARRFDGVKTFIAMPNTAKSRLNFTRESRYTISAWVYLENTDSHSHVIVSKGNTQYFLWYSPIHLSSTLWEFADFRDGAGWDLATVPVSTGAWVHLVGVHDGASHTLYANGEQIDTLILYSNSFSLSRNDQSDLMIGKFAQVMASPKNDEGYCHFGGVIDEVQISGVARSAEWVRLAYRNQMKENKLVSFK